ncbi:MAG TPA: hypothetical protein PLP13_07615 [bacterium]|nr:hypothetical protein [bacterium]HOL49658.1 hypothetical protein [bacterium]HXK44889.1 hypothetical protein [bacterium]
MIQIEITLAITGYLFLSLLILFLWLFGETRKKPVLPVKKENYVWQCPLCFHIYVDSSGSDISKCPLCGSLHKKHESGYNVNKENLSENQGAR